MSEESPEDYAAIPIIPVVDCTCDFSSGTRGMDRCGRCGGSGSRFIVQPNRFFPNTRIGYEHALEAEIFRLRKELEEVKKTNESS